MPALPLSQPAATWITAITIAGFTLLFAIVALRLHTLQITDAESLVQRSQQQRRDAIPIPAVRGGLFDSDGVPLVVSEGTWTLFADPEYMNDKLAATVELARITGIPRDTLRACFEHERNGRVVARGLRDAEPGGRDIPGEIRAWIRATKATGLGLRREFVRTYKEVSLAPHVLGFVGGDGKGGAGIEQAFDTALRGEDGEERPIAGRSGADAVERTPARPGAHIQLTINLAIQRKLDEVVKAAAAKHLPQNVAGVVVRPATGEILAMASWPDFDPSDRKDMKPESLRNNALSFVYEPGSTVKPLFTGAAVADGVASWGERIDCEHGAWTYRTGRAARTVHEKTGGHGVLSLSEGIALSDNIMMAKLGVRIGERFGAERLHDWARTFGFGQPCGLGLPGDEKGQVAPKAKWTLTGACMSVPMGHEIAITPIQLALAHAAVANGGIYNPPRLIRRMWTDAPTGPVELDLPDRPEPRRIFSAANAAQIQAAMTGTMTEGTAKRSQLTGYTSAGKTGTAEKVINGRYSNRNVGSFVCWAPAEPGVRPEILGVIVVDDPSQNGRFGADTAAPAVAEVLQYALEYLRVPKREVEPPPPPVRRRQR